MSSDAVFRNTAVQRNEFHAGKPLAATAVAAGGGKGGSRDGDCNFELVGLAVAIRRVVVEQLLVVQGGREAAHEGAEIDTGFRE